jgi:septal ring factor EnvC (AmiA/AmiB activator)
MGERMELDHISQILSNLKKQAKFNDNVSETLKAIAQTNLKVKKRILDLQKRVQALEETRGNKQHRK